MDNNKKHPVLEGVIMVASVIMILLHGAAIFYRSETITDYIAHSFGVAVPCFALWLVTERDNLISALKLEHDFRERESQRADDLEKQLNILRSERAVSSGRDVCCRAPDTELN